MGGRRGMYSGVTVSSLRWDEVFLLTLSVWSVALAVRQRGGVTSACVVLADTTRGRVKASCHHDLWRVIANVEALLFIPFSLSSFFLFPRRFPIIVAFLFLSLLLPLRASSLLVRLQASLPRLHFPFPFSPSLLYTLIFRGLRCPYLSFIFPLLP